MGKVHRPQLAFRFPWRAGNRFELRVDAEGFYPPMLEAIARARRFVWLEMYLCESGAVANRFIEALAAAARRGVAVRVLLDAFGARGLARADRQRLADSGVALAFYNPLRLRRWTANLARDHRKLLVVDGERVFVGGAGITDEFDPPGQPKRRWRETMLEITGPVTADWQQLFAQAWARAVPDAALPPAPCVAAPAPAASGGGGEGGMRGRVLVAQNPVHREITRALLHDIRRARRRVWLQTAYFIPSWRLRRALRRAARRGLDVRLLLPGPYTDHPAVRYAAQRFYERLLAAGVRIFEYQPRVLHSKVALCDDRVSLGSSNFDRWSLHWNLEANQQVDDAAFAARVQAMFEADFACSVECRYPEWRRRAWWVRWRERFWGSVDRWLNRLGHGR